MRVDISQSVIGKNDIDQCQEFIQSRIPHFLEMYREDFGERSMYILGLANVHEGVFPYHRAVFLYHFAYYMFAKENPVASTIMDIIDDTDEEIVARSVYEAVIVDPGDLYDGLRIGAPGLGSHAKFEGLSDNTFGIYENHEELTERFLEFERFLMDLFTKIGLGYRRGTISNR